MLSKEIIGVKITSIMTIYALPPQLKFYPPLRLAYPLAFVGFFRPSSLANYRKPCEEGTLQFLINILRPLINFWKCLTPKGSNRDVKNVISCQLMILNLHIIVPIDSHVQTVILDLVTASYEVDFLRSTQTPRPL